MGNRVLVYCNSEANNEVVLFLWFRSFRFSMTYSWFLDAFVYPQSEILVFMEPNTCSLPSTISGLGFAAYLKTSVFVEAFHPLYQGQAFSKTFQCLVDEWM